MFALNAGNVGCNYLLRLVNRWFDNSFRVAFTKHAELTARSMDNSPMNSLAIVNNLTEKQVRLFIFIIFSRSRCRAFFNLFALQVQLIQNDVLNGFVNHNVTSFTLPFVKLYTERIRQNVLNIQVWRHDAVIPPSAYAQMMSSLEFILCCAHHYIGGTRCVFARSAFVVFIIYIGGTRCAFACSA